MNKQQKLIAIGYPKKAITKPNRKIANGMFLSMSNIGVTLGTTIGGFIILSYGTSYIMLTAIIIQLMAFCLFLIRTKKYPTV